VEDFPSRLRRLRDKSGLKRYKLSDFCGLSPDSIRKYERGEIEPTLKSLESIANFFNISVDYLIGRSDDPTWHK